MYRCRCNSEISVKHQTQSLHPDLKHYCRHVRKPYTINIINTYISSRLLPEKVETQSNKNKLIKTKPGQIIIFPSIAISRVFTRFQLTPARGRKRDPLAQLTQWNKGKIFHVISILEGRIYCKYFGLNNCAING